MLKSFFQYTKLISYETFHGISIDKIHGIDVEKSKTNDTDTTAITNLVTSGALMTSNENYFFILFQYLL